MNKWPSFVLALVLALVAPMAATAADPATAKPRARDLGIPFDGAPGKWNAITDVPDVAVGYSTLIRDQGAHAVRTGVTAILPRGNRVLDKPVYAGFFSLNGNGEMTGTHWIEEGGFLDGPVMITGTHYVGVVRDAVIQWRIRHGGADADGYFWSLPVVAETWDGDLSDAKGLYVKPEHAFAAIDTAKSGAVAEGNVGGGTGMICHDFKGGTGTSSRVVKIDGANYTVGVLVQANYGVREELRVAGVPVGKFMRNDLLRGAANERRALNDPGSIIVVIATDAPLLPHQLKRVARRASMGLARNGSYAGNGSGDIFVAFSTANESAAAPTPLATVRTLNNDELNALFLATVQAVEESIINTLIAAETMTGVGGNKAVAIDHQELQRLLKQYGRLSQ